MASPAVLEFEKRIPEDQRGRWDAFSDAQKEEHVARVQEQQRQLFKEYAEASSEEGKIAALNKYQVPEAQRSAARQQFDAEIARQKAGATQIPAKPIDPSFHHSRLQRSEPEVAVNLAHFEQATEDQAIVSALLLWAVFGTNEQREAAKTILGDVSAETLKDQAKCEELVKNFNRQKFNEQKLQLKIRQINGKFYVLISEKMAVAANEVKENLLKHEALPAEVPAKISFKALTEKANQDNFLKSLRTQFLPEGKTARDENVKSAELVKEELVVEFKDEAKLRLKFSGDGAIQATYQAKAADLNTKGAVLMAFAQMAKKFYATFLEAELASNKDACPESFDITISLKSSELAGVSSAEIAKQFHENGFAKVCVKIDEAAEIFESKTPANFAPPKTESPIAQYTERKKKEVEEQQQAAQLKANLEQSSKAATTPPEQQLALTRHLEHPEEVMSNPLELPPILSVLPYPMVTANIKAARDWLFPRPDFQKVRELARAKTLDTEQTQEFAKSLVAAQQQIDAQKTYAAGLLRAALAPPLNIIMRSYGLSGVGMLSFASYIPLVGPYVSTIISCPLVVDALVVKSALGAANSAAEKALGKKAAELAGWEVQFLKAAPAVLAVYVAGSSWTGAAVWGVVFDALASKYAAPLYYQAKEGVRSYRVGATAIAALEAAPKATAWVSSAKQALFKKIMPGTNQQGAPSKPLTKS